MRRTLFALLGVCGLLSCTGDEIPDVPVGAVGGDVRVVFDVSARPLPEVPLPNDFATFPDPTSRTGRRIQASLMADTSIERHAREGFAGVEGWGTFAPVSVQFNYPGRENSTVAAINLSDLRERMGRDYDFENDAIYVIALDTGVPAPMDVGQGNYPMWSADLDDYGPNDVHGKSETLLFDDHEEGAGLPQSAYKPELDTDFDGVLDHPNVFQPGATKDQLMSWYERETDSLILRPLIPMRSATTYAVVITDRLRAFDGKAISSPFQGVAHASQSAEARQVGKILSDPARANYYGDLAGTGLSRVSFLWSFTTQPVHDDLLALRNGLYGHGPYSRLSKEYPTELEVLRAVGPYPASEEQPADWKTRPGCATKAEKPYIVKLDEPDVKTVFHQMYSELFDYDIGEIKGLEEAVENIDYVVIGTYKSPFFRGGPNEHNPDSIFDMRASKGEAKQYTDTVSFWLAVPKATAQHKPPFPVTVWGHGAGGQATEAVQHGANLARQGVATLTINMPLHGLPDWRDVRAVIGAALAPKCLAPWTSAVLTGRARDENGDGDQDPAHWWWTAHVANVRDNVRQGALDQMQMTRILKSFDGVRRGGQDLNGDGTMELAGDFNSDGIVDVGGPNVPIYTAGGSLGGIMSDILGALDPNVEASAPMAGGGGLGDIAVRSYGVSAAMFQLISPIIFGSPASDYYPTAEDPNRAIKTSCAKEQRSIRLSAVDGPEREDIEIACLSPEEAAADMTVLVNNKTARTLHCTSTAADTGRFRVPVGASKGDKLEIQFFKGAHQVDNYKDCNVPASAVPSRVIRTFEVKKYQYSKIAPDMLPCPETAESGCAQYMGVMYPVGSQLVSPQEGYGFQRNSPQLRRFFSLAQVALEPADPINFAPHFMLDPFPMPDGSPGKPKAVLHVNTVGDGFVSAHTGVSFARASGAVPFLRPDQLGRYPEYNDYVTPPALYAALGDRTPTEVLLQTHTVEGMPRYQRHPAAAPLTPNYRMDVPECTARQTFTDDDRKNALFDVDNMSDGLLPWAVQRLASPLRLARRANVRVTDAASLEKAWEPRLRGVPGAPDQGAWDASDPLVGFANVYIRTYGKHTWDVPDSCKIWDDATYGAGMSARFMSTGGRDLYYLSHPSTFACLSNNTCPFLGAK